MTTNLTFSRSAALNNIPKKKLEQQLYLIESSNEDFSIKSKKITAINRFAESNIPIEYWRLNMERDFGGDKTLYNKYKEIISDIDKFYLDGKSLCFTRSTWCSVKQ